MLASERKLAYLRKLIFSLSHFTSVLKSTDVQTAASKAELSGQEKGATCDQRPWIDH